MDVISDQSLGNWLLAHEAGVRLTAFALVLGVLAAAERLWPLRGDARLRRRQLHNFGLIVVDTALLRIAFPVLAVAWALHIEQQGFGLLHWLDLRPWLAIPLALVLLDLAIYWQHRLFHAIPLLWRLHRVHHSDLGFDVSTGVRFHPLEIALSMLIKLGLIAVLGAPALAVLLFELLLSLGSLFTHADFALPQRLDRTLRRLLVTPSMHRIHHSNRRRETDSNYGFHLSIWDRLFRSYRSDARGGETGMTIGLDEYRPAHQQRLLALLLQPFRSTRSSDR